MKPLWVTGVSGFNQEFYYPDTSIFTSHRNYIADATLDACSIFWRRFLGESNVRDLVEKLEENSSNKDLILPQFSGVLSDKEKYISKVLDYRVSVCDQDITPQDFHSRLETLEILCQVKNKLSPDLFKLNIQNGYLLSEVSLRDTVNNCMNPSNNPYISFVKEQIIPLILDYSPDVLFLTGRVTLFNAAVSKIIKGKKKDIRIIYTRHSTEYYSISKVIKYIKNNNYFNEIADGIILDDFSENEGEILLSLSKGGDIPRSNDVIVLNTTSPIENGKISDQLPNDINQPIIISRKKQDKSLSLTPDEVHDIRLEPHFKCYWNKCSFCGINKKYTFNNTDTPEEVLSQNIDNLCTKLPRKSYLWFIDEAIHPSKLEKMAESFSDAGREFVWQARCRVDKGLLKEGLAKKLAQSGLTELRLGLESASLSVLQSMRKFEDSFKLEDVYEIVNTYYKYGVFIHFPIIIGFPGEELIDRQRTYAFLSDIVERYPGTTFNINIFNLDVSSAVFKFWDKFHISDISFPCSPDDFIGNIVSWNSPYKESDQILDMERNNFTRKKMFPWMPSTAFISPIIFYRLSETIRNTLIWKNKIGKVTNRTIGENTLFVRNDDLVVLEEKTNRYLAYNWSNHHFMEGGIELFNVLEEWKNPKEISIGINNMCRASDICEEDLSIYTSKMIEYGHLVVSG